MIFGGPVSFRSFDCPCYPRCIYAYMPGYLGRREAELFPATQSDCGPCIAYPPSLTATPQFGGTDPVFPTFLFDDLFDGPAGASGLKLTQLPLLGFFHNIVDEVPSAKDACIKVFLLPSPPHGQYL